MIDGINFFDQPIKDDLKHTITLERLRRINYYLVMIT